MGTTRNALTRRGFCQLIGASGLIATSMGLAGCGDNKQAPAAGDKPAFKLGGIGPVTGAAAIYGNATANGSALAVKELNAQGDIQLVFNNQDDEHDAEKSVNAYNTLKDWGMQVLIGTTTTAPSVAVSAEAHSDKIFMLTPSASSTDVIGGQPDANGTVSIPRKENVFQMCFTDPNQGVASADFLAANKLGERIAVIYNNSDAYSSGVYEKFAKQAEAKGLNIVSVTTFTDDTATDFSVQLNDAKNNNADLVFIPIYYTPASLILKQANSMGYAPRFFGVDGLDGLLTLEGFDKALAEGVMLLTPFTADAQDEKTKKFVEAYSKDFGGTPNQFAADAYDCVYAVYKALKACGATPDMSAADLSAKLIETFTSADFSFDGLTGTGMKWSNTGEVSKEPKGMVIKNGAYVGM